MIEDETRCFQNWNCLRQPCVTLDNDETPPEIFVKGKLDEKHDDMIEASVRRFEGSKPSSVITLYFVDLTWQTLLGPARDVLGKPRKEHNRYRLDCGPNAGVS